MKIKNERQAHAALLASVNAGAIIQHAPRINRAALRSMRRQERREKAGEIASGTAFVFLLALCFSPMFF